MLHATSRDEGKRKASIQIKQRTHADAKFRAQELRAQAEELVPFLWTSTQQPICEFPFETLLPFTSQSEALTLLPVGIFLCYLTSISHFFIGMKSKGYLDSTKAMQYPLAETVLFTMKHD